MADAATVRELQDRANRLRAHSLRATTEAGSGHPTSCLSAAEIAAAVFFHAMRYDPHDPRKATNDRFILSKGHAAPLLYAVMVEFGVVSEAELMCLRQIDSDLEGHPTPRLPFVDVATGSLGQGLSVGIGMALAAGLDGLDCHTYVLTGDGEAAEGAVWEAINFAGHRGIASLTAIIDCNRLGQSDPTMYQHDTEAYVRRLEAFGWHAVSIDGHDIEAIIGALAAARTETGRPSAIVARTLKGKGVSFFEDQEGWHGKPVPAERLAEALAEIGAPESMPPATPKLPPDPPEAETAPAPSIVPGAYEGGAATRKGYGEAIAKLVRADKRIVALDGDTKNSTYSQTVIAADPTRFIEAYIAEQNLLGMAVGLSTRGKIPFASTFGAFFARAYDQIRMAGISGVNIKLVGSHAGISIGEDGPSQMGLEDIAIMRAVHGSTVLCPADAVSCERLTAVAAATPGVVFIRTSRPSVKTLYKPDEPFPVGRFKVLRQSAADKALVVAAGVTVHEALSAHDTLKAEGIGVRVIDLYSIKPLDAEGLQKEAKEAGGTVVTVEDHYPEGGLGDAVLGALAGEAVRVTKLAVNGLPRSGKAAELFEAFGISAGHIVKAVRAATR